MLRGCFTCTCLRCLQLRHLLGILFKGFAKGLSWSWEFLHAEILVSVKWEYHGMPWNSSKSFMRIHFPKLRQSEYVYKILAQLQLAGNKQVAIMPGAPHSGLLMPCCIMRIKVTKGHQNDKMKITRAPRPLKYAPSRYRQHINMTQQNKSQGTLNTFHVSSRSLHLRVERSTTCGYLPCSTASQLCPTSVT